MSDFTAQWKWDHSLTYLSVARSYESRKSGRSGQSSFYFLSIGLYRVSMIPVMRYGLKMGFSEVKETRYPKMNFTLNTNVR